MSNFKIVDQQGRFLTCSQEPVNGVSELAFTNKIDLPVCSFETEREAKSIAKQINIIDPNFQPKVVPMVKN